MSHPYRHSVERCFGSVTGRGGVPDEAFDAHLERAHGAAMCLGEAVDSGKLPAFACVYDEKGCEALDPFVRHWRQEYSDIVVLGVGGSSLGAQVLAQLNGWQMPGRRERGWREGDPPGFHFPDNLDPSVMSDIVQTLDLRRTGFLVISKSGRTLETLAQMLAVMTAIRNAGDEKYISDRFLVLTEPDRGMDNPLRKIAGKWGIPVLDHDPHVGGRFSVFSSVGMLPAKMMGLDVEKIRKGGADVLRGVMDASLSAPVEGAAMTATLCETRSIAAHILIAYTNRLERFGYWFRQLWAESLGKDGKGTVPVAGLGPVEQHGLLQLYLEGPKDKIYTLLTVDTDGQGPVISPDLARSAGQEFLANRHPGDIVAAEQRATRETLARHGCPVREIMLERVDEYTTGALMMHYMIETVLVADLWGVDPYSQPAVEEGKVLTREYLGKLPA